LSNPLPARYAECIFWLARFVERAENLARILEVHETYARDKSGARDWFSIVQLNADEEMFAEKHAVARARNVIRFYLTDRENPTSILNTVKNARENGRTLRPLISTEMWVQLNVFYNRLNRIDDRELTPGALSPLLNDIKQACQTFTGITEGTFYRDQAWYFYRLGRYLERADQTTRLLDIKYHLLLPQLSDVGSPIDVSQWNAVLRSAAGYHAYRRLHAASMTPARVAGFLLLNQAFPRSVHHCLREVDRLLAEVKSRYGLCGANDAAEELDRLRAVFGTLTITAILGEGLHEFLDLVQRQLNAVTRDLALAFFGYAPGAEEAPAAAQ